jgi:AcrR family transcriptional regulator
MNIQSRVTSSDLFDGDPDDTEAALMAATYRALCAHGYAELTIQRIGEEFGKSNSLLYHHYEGKDDLLVAFLDYVLERFESDVPFEELTDPWERVERLLDHVLAPTLPEERREFTSAMMELRAQAAHDPAFREAFTRHDAFFHDRLVAVVRDGVEQGRFRDVDAEAVASLLQTTFNGVMLQRATTDAGGGVAISDVRDELESALATQLLGEGEPADRTASEGER